MIPENIKQEHIIGAMNEIDKNGGIPKRRGSNKYQLLYRNCYYPPKYVISIANRFANGTELNPSQFSAGDETNNYLKKLGFKILDNSTSSNYDTKVCKRSDRKCKPKSISQSKNIRHNERCKECKNTIKKFLEKIYGDVRTNYKFDLSPQLKDFKDYTIYPDLKNIYTELSEHRGHDNFVKSSKFPRVDYFVPIPGFVVEFDESQHFTEPRKISLQNYPAYLKTGFSVDKWIEFCNHFNKKDNDPVYRDEQRAWYDTLRDFLPSIYPLHPTVRLFSCERKWCSLDSENEYDVHEFQKIIEHRESNNMDEWLATLIFETTSGEHSNNERLEIMSDLVNQIISKGISGDGIILFPAGWFNTGKEKPNTIYDQVKNKLIPILNQSDNHIYVCTGIDGREFDDGYSRDQISLAIDKYGIKAAGRKFYPTDKEKYYIKDSLAENHLSFENGYSRIFELNGKYYYLAVCYDVFGIKNGNIEMDEKVDTVLNLVHQFHPKGSGKPSGESYFVRNGLSGASLNWNCPVYVSAVYFDRNAPQNWPSGVYWNRSDKNTKCCRYDEISISPTEKLDVKKNQGELRFYSINQYN